MAKPCASGHGLVHDRACVASRMQWVDRRTEYLNFSRRWQNLCQWAWCLSGVRSPAECDAMRQASSCEGPCSARRARLDRTEWTILQARIVCCCGAPQPLPRWFVVDMDQLSPKREVLTEWSPSKVSNEKNSLRRGWKSISASLHHCDQLLHLWKRSMRAYLIIRMSSQ